MSELLVRIRALEVGMDRLFIMNLAASILFAILIMNSVLVHCHNEHRDLLKLSLAQLGEIKVERI